MWSSSLTEKKNIKYLNQTGVDYVIQYWGSLEEDDAKKKLKTILASGSTDNLK